MARMRQSKQKKGLKQMALAKMAARGKYLLRLYITGTTPQSQQALFNIKSVCEEYLKGCYELEVIDIYQRPKLAKDEQIIAVPTLIKFLPPPLRRLIGDLSDEERVLLGLDLTLRRNKKTKRTMNAEEKSKKNNVAAK